MQAMLTSFHLSAWGVMCGQPLVVNPIDARRSGCRTT